MYNDEKIWSIELGEDLEIEETKEKRSEPLAPPPPVQGTSRIVLRKKPVPAPLARKKAPFRLHFALLMPLTWLLGPFAILLTPEGRQRKDWALLGLIVGLAWVALTVWGGDLLVRSGGGPVLAPLMFLYTSVIFAGFTVWARAVHLAGGANRPADHKLPGLFRQSWGTGLLGILFPGMGLLAAGHPRRAAAVLWLGWFPVAALVLLRAAPWLWRIRTEDGAVFMDALQFEKILLFAAAVVAMGVFGWLVQALDGARLAPGETLRIGARRGDLFGLALLAAVMALFAVAEPGPVARRLGYEARTLRAEGLRLVPLTMVRTAAFLDPGRTDYTVIAMEIYEAMGQENKSQDLRRQLDRNLASYRDLVRLDQAASEPPVQEAAPTMGTWTVGDLSPWGLVAPAGWHGAPEKKRDPERLAAGSPSQN